MRWVVVAALVVSIGCGHTGDLPWDTKPWNTIKIKTLTVEQAEALAKHEGELRLDGLTTITPEVAKALAKGEGLLSLNGLTTITPEALKILRENHRIGLPSEFAEKP
jgi:hypothetical protein